MARTPKRKRLAQVLPDLLSVYRSFWQDIRPQSVVILGSLSALLVGVLFRLLEPWPLKLVIDYAFEHLPTSESTPASPTASWQLTLMLLALAVILIAGCRAMADYASRLGFFVVGNRVVIAVRNRVYRHLQSLPMMFHDNSRNGDLVVRVTRDVSLLRDVAGTAVLPLLASTLVLLGMLAVMLWACWQLALLTLIILPLYWVTTVRIGRRIRASARKQRKRESAMAAVAAEVFGSIRGVKALCLQEHFASDFGKSSKQSQQDDLKASRLSYRLARTVDVLLAIATAAVLWYGGAMVLGQNLKPGDLVLFMIYLKRGFKPAQEFAKYSARMAKAAAAGERVLHLLQQVPEEDPCQTALVSTPPRKAAGKIEFQNVSFSYEARRATLRMINLTIAPGTCVAVVGPSGAGKSTLLNLLLRLYRPTEGRILVDDRDVEKDELHDLRSRFSVVLQDPLLFHGTIRQNIQMGDSRPEVLSLERAAILSRVNEFSKFLPDGLDTSIGEHGNRFSRGQMQRIAIARAAYRNAPIWLLDEPTTGLDTTNARIISDAIFDLTQGRTTILVTHDPRLSARADVIVYVADGMIQERGAPEVLRAACGLYSAMCASESCQVADGSRPQPALETQPSSVGVRYV